MSRTSAPRSASLLALFMAVAAAATPADAVLITSSTSPRITQLDDASGAVVGIFVPPCELGFTTASRPRLGPDGRMYVGTNGAVYLIDPATGVFNDVFVSGLPGTVFATVHAPDGSLWAAMGNEGLAHADGVTGAVLDIVSVGNGVALALGADGHLYIGDGTTGEITRRSSATGALIDTFTTAAGGTTGLGFGPDGRLYAVLRSPLNDVERFDPATGASLGRFIPAGDPHPANPRGPSWGADGHLYVSSNANGQVLRYDGTTGAFLDVFASNLQAPGSPSFAANLPLGFGLLPEVATTSGPIRGFSECGVRTYNGIPFAEPPTGELRWRRPAPKVASPTPILALGQGPACPQVSGGDEDCLKLSIWRPDAPPATPLPVLFYIHGGGLWQGSAAGPLISGANFARNQNAIVVEPQYRLGALGFLGLPALAAEDANGSTGNYGFLDQLEALRWVRDNIAAFGGDPNQVTIAGESAGGWSTCALLASPLSDGLFRAAVVQSGQCGNARPLTLPAGSPVLNDPLFGDTIFERGAQVAAGAGCTQVDPAAQLACLRAASASSLVSAYAALPRGLANEQPVNPAIDGYVLTEQPVVMLRQGAGDGRALVIGTVANESTFYSYAWDFPSAEFYELVLRTGAGNTRANALLPLYPGASYAPEYEEAMRVLVDDTSLVCPTLDVADAAAQGGSPAWVYHLTFPPVYGPPPAQPIRRTFHTLDLYYVFGSYARLATDYGIVVGPNDAAMSASMQNAWGSFVRTGVPETTPAWPAYAPATPGDLASVSVLQFDVPNNTISGTAFRSGRCAALVPVGNFLDADRDIATYDEDNCPVTANSAQVDFDIDAAGDVCDNCSAVANARVASDFLAANPWATLTGGQRDDDHDGFGNKCDADFPGTTAGNVGPADLAQFRASNGESRLGDTCGTNNARACAIFDLDENTSTANNIGPGDLARFRTLQGSPAGPKCATCPLVCTAGADGSCD